MDLSKRTPEEIFAHHSQALGTENLEALVLDYADNAFLIFGSDVLRGKEAIRTFFANFFQTLPKAQWGFKTTFVEDILSLEWTCDSPEGSVSDGVDTFAFQNGLIRAQTIRSTIIPKTLSTAG